MPELTVQTRKVAEAPKRSSDERKKNSGLTILGQKPQSKPEPNISKNGLKYFIKTYGCAMNYSDTERIESKLENYGYRKASKIATADLVIFNTCSVRQKAEDRVFGQLKNMRELKKTNPSLLVGITGCMVRKSSSTKSLKKDKLLNRSEFLDFAFRIEDSAQIGELISELNPDLIFPDFNEAELGNYFAINPKYTSKTQAFVPVGTGCDKFCTYCIVPYSRGRERSRDFNEIVDECTKLVEDGVIEITLVGQTVNSYGRSSIDRQSGKFIYRDDKTPFTELLEELDKLHEKGLKRLRFTSPHPRDVHPSLMQAIANLKTLMPYIHMPIQAGHDETLKRMNRNYRIAEYRKIITELRKAVPNIAISTDIIVGFCGETEEEYKTTLNIYKEFQFDHCYFAQYSPRSKTFSADHLKDDVAAKVKRERWHNLNALVKEISAKKLKKFAGQTLEVLFDKKEDNTYVGRSEHFKEVKVKAGRDILGQLLKVKITKTLDFHLEGELA